MKANQYVQRHEMGERKPDIRGATCGPHTVAFTEVRTGVHAED